MKRSSFEKRLCDRGIWDILQVCHCVLFDINMIPPYPFKVKHECNMPRVGMDGYVDTHRNKKEAKCASIKQGLFSSLPFMIRVKGIHQGYVLSVYATSMFYKNRHDNPISVILKPVRYNSIFWKFKFQCMLRFVIFKRHHPSLSVHDWLGCVKLYEKPQFKDIEYLNSNN